MKKILVLFTGGTIGSISDNGVTDVDESGKYLLISQYESIYGHSIEFECRRIMNILSENITSCEWELLADELSRIDFKAYSGVIITHGSDTLAYTAAFVGMLFRHSPVPVILIAANRPLNESGTNGLYNFSCAVKIISDGKYRGVFTVYEKVYLSTRMLPADTCLDRFSSYGGDEFYRISEEMLRKRFEPLLRKPLKLEKSVLKIYGYPDIDFTAYNIPESAGAVLFVPYHSATACTDSKSSGRNITLLAEKCSERKIPLYVCGVKSGGNIYASLDKMLKAGIKPLGRISDVSAYIKLLIGINQTEYPTEQFMNTDIYFETVK
ncbi:asparaginase [Ruminococcus sp. Marseille-P6503]|uniref:asparaginase n=1 Tax=Ruminococcus sp. Marseille-P6503 TaxID=2364796 RepID=UPI0013DDDC3D|nr:asparaginase [Ruminococcus sp. Marseille-P6503]